MRKNVSENILDVDDPWFGTINAGDQLRRRTINTFLEILQIPKTSVAPNERFPTL